MTTDLEFEQLLAAAEVTAHLPTTHVHLDMATGGGEFLSSLARLPPECWATEAYPPTIPIAVACLEPLGVPKVRRPA